jgi:aminoglycoside 3-N-acetyltransferase
MEGELISFRELVNGLRSLGIQRHLPVIAHASLSAFGYVARGADALLGAVLAVSEKVMMPTFTYKTMIIPEAGPPDNGIRYGSQGDQNRQAEFFHPKMPADRLMGVVAETLRRHPLAWRSTHPILSFAAIGLDEVLETQTLADPLAPIGKLAEMEGWVLLLGVDHTVNTSIHYAEKLAGRKGFVRWALTDSGILECPGFPGCSLGFQAIEGDLQDVIRKSKVGPALVQAVPLQAVFDAVRSRLHRDPRALLCADLACTRCSSVRATTPLVI